MLFAEPQYRPGKLCSMAITRLVKVSCVSLQGRTSPVSNRQLTAWTKAKRNYRDRAKAKACL